MSYEKEEKYLSDYLKKIRNKEIEPQLTTFMVQYNISDLNTDAGKLRCNERNTANFALAAAVSGTRSFPVARLSVEWTSCTFCCL